jgi:hypothetical protein
VQDVAVNTQVAIITWSEADGTCECRAPHAHLASAHAGSSPGSRKYPQQFQDNGLSACSDMVRVSAGTSIASCVASTVVYSIIRQRAYAFSI